MSVAPARKIAFEILRRVEAEGAYASDALHAALGPAVIPPDAALATELTLGVLRWRAQLDFMLERHLKKPVTRLDLPVAIALRLGIYQLRFLQRVPARAAVHESVELVKAARKSSAAPLANAVLRKAAAESGITADRFLPQGVSPANRLAILYSHPEWLVERWLARFGEARTIALLEANNKPPALSCAVTNPALREAVAAELAADHLQIAPGRLLLEALSVRGGSPSHTKAFLEGRLAIQDEASQAIPLLLATQSGDRVIDVCAAPGGKTATLARAAKPQGLVIAGDRHAHRLLAVRAQMRRLDLPHVQLVVLDAEKPLPFSAAFDRVLVDAPCSGTGTLARHPEIRWRLEASQLAEFHSMQAAMLRSAVGQLGPGGRLVYSTCSMEPEENENVVTEVLRESNAVGLKLARVPRAEAIKTLAPHLAPGVQPESLFDADSQFRTFPDRDGTDGFFAALLEVAR